jgi:hypothetical protein
MRSRLSRVSAALLVVLAAGCGKSGPPAPPLRMVPAPAQDLTVTQRGSQVLLELSYPKTTPGGVLLSGISALEVWDVSRLAPKTGEPQPLDPRQYVAAATLILKLAGPDLALVTAGDRLLVRLPAPEATAEAPVAHHYVVRTIGPRGDRSEVSNQAILVTQAPPPAPEELNATPKPEGIEITWRPPSRGGELVKGFNVYRRDSTAREYGKPLATIGPTETRYLDATATFGGSYIYAVTSVGHTAPLVESAIQAEREVRYLDRFPPPPPGDLVALAESGQVRLVWRSSPAADLAGYHVYRRDPDGAPRRLTTAPIAALEYTNGGLAPGRTFLYRVTAVDQAANESDPSAEVAATIPP